MLWLSSWSCASGPSFFSTSFTVAIAAVVSSRASRDVSRILRVVLRQGRRRRANLIELALERAGLRRRLLDLGFRLRAAARAALRAPRAPSSSVSSVACVCSACDDSCCTASRCFCSSPSGPIAFCVVCSACLAASFSAWMRLSTSSSSCVRSSSAASRLAISSSRAVDARVAFSVDLLERLAERRQLGAARRSARSASR